MSYLVGMRKLVMLAMTLGMVGSMTALAMGEPREEVNDALVQQQIDAQLFAVLKKMRLQRYHR